MLIRQPINVFRSRIAKAQTANGDSSGSDQRVERRWLTAALLFLAHLGIYEINGDHPRVGDATCSTYLPVLLITRGSMSVTPTSAPFMFDWRLRTEQGTTVRRFSRWDDWVGAGTARKLRERGDLTFSNSDYYLTPSNRTDPVTGDVIYVNTFGPVPALLALPAFVAAQGGRGGWLDRPMELWQTGKFVASVLVAGSVAFVYLAARLLTGRRKSILIAVSYGLGTCVWSTSSQALWQHGPNEFFLAVGTYFFLRSRQYPPWALATGLAYALAVASRPTSILVVIAIGAYLVIVDRQSLALYVFGGLPIAAALASYQLYYHGSLLSVGRFVVDRQIAVTKTGSADLWGTPLWEGVAGLLVSPSRGLFIFSPFMLFALFGFVSAWTDKRFTSLQPLTVAFVAQLVVASKWFDWWGGWCYGYRPIVDTMPLLAIMLVPAVERVALRKTYGFAFALLLAWSIGVQFVGAFAYDIVGWNARLERQTVPSPPPSASKSSSDRPATHRSAGANLDSRVVEVRADIDLPQYRHRLWSLKDNEILYYLVNFWSSRNYKRLRMHLPIYLT